jgi:hypothetical protein
LLYIVSAFLIIIPVTTGFTSEQPKSGEVSPQPKNEAVYIMPEQLCSPLKFGVAITPDQYTRSMDYRFPASVINPFDDDYKMSQHADVSSVVRIALHEFKFFSGLNYWIQDMEKTVDGYSRKFMLTGEFNLDPRNADPVDYIEKVNFIAEIYKAENVRPFQRNQIKSILSQFEINRVTWNMGFLFDRPGISFKLGIGDALMIQSSAGEDVKVGVMIRLSI